MRSGRRRGAVRVRDASDSEKGGVGRSWSSTGKENRLMARRSDGIYLTGLAGWVNYSSADLLDEGFHVLFTPLPVDGMRGVICGAPEEAEQLLITKAQLDELLHDGLRHLPDLPQRKGHADELHRIVVVILFLRPVHPRSSTPPP